jgi:hypothetical protein
MKKTPLKQLIWAAAIGMALIAAGCGLPSVYPFYTNKDVVFEPALVGLWFNVETNADDHGTDFAKSGDNAYTIREMKTSDTNVYAAHLFRLKNQLFLDCVPQLDGQMIPAHILLKVEQIQPTFKTATLNEDWMEKLLNAHPRALRHMVNEHGTGDSGIVLTADTAELQTFLRKYMDSKDTFGEPAEMKRR